MCRNLARKVGAVIAFDVRREPLERLQVAGVKPATSVRHLVNEAAVVMLCLPGRTELEAVCRGPDGLLQLSRSGQVVVDLGTSPVKLIRELADQFERRGTGFADAPVARTREAAEAGTLSIMVGGRDETFAQLVPLLHAMATDITHCGPPGAGQLAKLLNNMVLFETGVALAEALAVAQRSGLDPALLLSTLAKGSADSFALRNHATKAMLPGDFPERAFSARYALKDISYALECARDLGLVLSGAELARHLLEEAISTGFGEQYWPVISKLIEQRADRNA
jgi:3-hydroxyisobutyrate dehydrogenase-like beta-hydroxyacid dehydrogenase